MHSEQTLNSLQCILTQKASCMSQRARTIEDASTVGLHGSGRAGERLDAAVA
jgi:hypothetical protein